MSATPNDLFMPAGELIAASANTPFLLTALDFVWFVETGNVDVFSVRVENDEPVGSRRHFCSFASGQILLGFGPPVNGRGLLAVAQQGTQLRRLRLSSLRDDSRDIATAPVVAALLDGWLSTVSNGAGRDVPAHTDIALEPGIGQAVPVNTRFRARSDVVWIPAGSGDALFLGMEEIAGENPSAQFPVAHGAWLQALTATHLTAQPTAAVISSDETWAGLAFFTQLVARCEALNRRFGEIDDLNRQKDRATQADKASGHALDELAAVLDATTPVVTTAVDDPLFQACFAIGKAQDIAIHPPEELLKAKPLTEPLAAILRVSRVRARVVALDKRWWTQSEKPMLGFMTEGHRPVALLPRASSYVIFDPQKHTEAALSIETAAHLEPVAHVFYRPFKADAISGLALLRFGARGLGPEIWRLMLLGLGGALLSMLPAVATGYVFDVLVPEGARGLLLQLTLGLLCVALAAAAFEFTRGLTLLRIEGKMDESLQAAVIDRVLKLPVPFFRNFTAGDLAHRTHGINDIRRVLSTALITVGLGNLFAWVNVIVLAAISLPLAAAAGAMLFLAVSFSALTVVQQVRVQRRVTAQQGIVSGLVLQFITGIAKLRVSGAEELAWAAWARSFARQKRDALLATRIGNRVVVFNAIFPLLASGVLFWLIAPVSGASHLSIGAFLVFLTAFTTLLTAMLAITSGLAGVLSVVPMLERIRPILQTPPEDNAGKLDPGTLSGRIELSQVSFRYSPESPAVLQNVSLQIEPGEFVAIVGESGSGKSTLLRLLLGFEKPQSGVIQFDGQDFARLDLTAVRNQIGVVLQTSQPTAGSILSNVIGARALLEDDAWQALRLAGLEDDIREMPMQLHTVLSTGGGAMSGGQKQRLMIARALVNRPRLLLFDEATSALDNRTQALVSQSLEQLAATRIVIAHRLSTIKRADRVIVMAAGKIVQSGRYEELLRTPGLFADLAARQRVENSDVVGSGFLF